MKDEEAAKSSSVPQQRAPDVEVSTSYKGTIRYKHAQSESPLQPALTSSRHECIAPFSAPARQVTHASVQQLLQHQTFSAEAFVTPETTVQKLRSAVQEFVSPLRLGVRGPSCFMSDSATDGIEMRRVCMVTTGHDID